MAIYKRPGKRAFDLFFSLLFIICACPLYILIAFLVKCTSTGPIFYKGLRMGQQGKLIECWKFRTMCLNADDKLHQILRTCPELDAEWKTYFKLKNDPRLTPIGKFLRKSSLDEIPQIWNVLKGDLSVVGPRPIAIENREKAQEEIRNHFGDKTEKILSVKPGLTCIWQIKGRNLLTFQERIVLEEEYVDTQSFALDLCIIMKTVPLIIFSKGAF